MAEKFFRMKRIAPRERQQLNGNSWSEKAKIYGIKVENDLPTVHKLISKKSTLESLKKLSKKCKWKLPVAMVVVSLIQIFFFAFAPLDYTYQTLAFSPSRTSQLWRFLTYSLLHAGPTHLLINVILQLIISCPLETELGCYRVLLVYFGGVCGGSLAASISSDASLMVGSSSGIYSLLMSHVAHICLNYSTISHRFLRIISVALLSISDFAYATFHCLINDNKEPKIHINAHISGAMSGVVLGFIFYGSPRQEKIMFKSLWWASSVLYLSFVVVVMLINCM